ncbi:response regulator [Acetatifactor aquisgranensis]|uniref:response regulator n=1 Tax=Acetatifactor aquisgranensis TaxID=2941233 RepID=UPI00203E9B97|nr:response regulator [Acetatifactor aquisgranensis]
MKIRSLKPEHHATHFLIGSFTVLLLVSIGAFVCLGRFMSKESEESIHTVGNLYMAGINNHITAHFRTLIDLKLEQAEGIVDTIPADISGTDELYEELVHRADVRNFNYVALYSTDGTIEMLDGSFLRLADPESFRESLAHHEKKVAVGYDSLGNEVVMFGLNAEYPMSNGEKSLALVVAVPIDYISAMLGTDEENALIFSSIIRKDGSFIISDMGSEYEDYFESLYARFPDGDPEKIGSYIQELSEAMEKKENYATVLDFDESNQQIYCTMLPYSEWHLITILPFGPLNETVEDLDRNRTLATLLVCSVIFVVLLIIFFIYYRTTCRQLKELEEARQEALAATKAKSSFLSNMSHDIRTPMNAIVGMTAIATAHVDDKEQVMNCLKKITLSGKHLLGLINDVLDMSKIESGKMTLTAELVSLQEVIEGVVGIVQTQIKGKSQHFNVHIDKITAEDVYCDSVRLNQVLLNLLSNAIKYTQEGGTIQLSLYQEDTPPQKGADYVRTHITVTDNGMGMSEEFQSHVFDSYSRVDTLRVHKTEGAGLGMAITKHIIDAMDGTITVKSQLGKGTEFHVILDLERATASEIDMVLPPWKMLVVDDDETLCRTAVDALESIGIQADWTLSGEKALTMVAKHHQSRDDYQIVMLDWKLPGMDGLYVAKQIRRIVGEEMPIILISAYDWSDFEADAKEAGINGFIAKPLFKSTLFYGLKKYMDIEENPDMPDDYADFSGKHVLVAEDNDLNWEILQALLSDIGMEVEWAENGKICLEKFQASAPGYYDVILMDVRMPVMNGYEATKGIRASSHPDAGTIPIIAMTADAFSEDIKQCLDCGMNAHTAKPINFEEVISLLKKHIL